MSIKTNFEMNSEKGLLSFINETDYIEVYLGNKYLGKIFKSEIFDEWDAITNGENPIESDWEDGLGNSLSYEGWGFDKEK